MSEKRRRPGIFAAIVADPWRKLLAIGLAVLLWFFIDSRIKDTHTRTVPLVHVGTLNATGMLLDRLAIALPTDRVVGLRFFDGDRPIDKVEVRISGPRFRIATIETERLDLQITAFLGLDWSTRTSIEFTVADVRRDQRVLQDLEIELSPPRIRLDVENIASREIPLSFDVVDLVEGAFVGRLRRDTAEFTPPSALVLGPAIGIDQLGKRTNKPFRAVMESGGTDRKVKAHLELIDGPDLGLKFATPPLLTMQVLPQTTKFELELPIVVDDLALPPEQRGSYQPEAKTRMVRVAAGGELRSRLVNMGEGGDSTSMAEWAAANLRLLVHIPRAEPGAAHLTEIDRPARLLLVGRLYETLDRNECLLDETVVVKLRQKT